MCREDKNRIINTDICKDDFKKLTYEDKQTFIKKLKNEHGYGILFNDGRILKGFTSGSLEVELSLRSYFNKERYSIGVLAVIQ